jgi:hypothetical protein
MDFGVFKQLWVTGSPKGTTHPIMGSMADNEQHRKMIPPTTTN